MNEIGIDDMISCYTMIPWALSFDYYDEATNRVQFLNTKPGDAAYADYWDTFLKDFLPPPSRERLVRENRHLYGRASDGGDA